MKRSPDSDERPKSRLVLTALEKLDARHPNLLFSVKAWLDQGVSADKLALRVQERFGVTVSTKTVEYFRTHRWVPEKELTALKAVTTKAAVEAFGGDVGLDAAVLAKLWELMDKMSVTQLLSARSLFVRIRAQNLKEQEFLFKTGQLKPGKPGDQNEDDPAVKEAKTRNVMNKIRGIFGLGPLPEEDEEETVENTASSEEVNGKEEPVIVQGEMCEADPDKG
jgi:hypothetical protein